MIITKFSKWLLSIKFSYVTIFIFIIIADFLINIISILFLQKKGRKKTSLKRFFNDKVAMLWPFFVLSPSILLLMMIFQNDFRITNEFSKVGYGYVGFLNIFSPLINDLIIGIVLIFAIVFVLISRLRIINNHKNSTWLTEVKGLIWIRGIVDVVIHFVIVISALALVYHWYTFYKFFNSGWKPTLGQFSDLFYGVGWIEDILFQEIFLITIISSSSLILSFREKRFGKVGNYTYGFLLSIIAILTITIILFVNFNHFLSESQSSLLRNINQQLLHNSTSNSIDLAKKVLLNMDYEQVSQLPSTIELPSWLQGVIGIRLFLVLLEIIDLSTNKNWQLSNLTKKLLNLLAD
jgi:hypothetical protein